MRCPSCGGATTAEARFCARCGLALDGRLSSWPEVDRTLVDAGRSRARASATSAAGDRRIVTAMFADLVDYVRMLAEHDPEEVRARVTTALGAMAAAIERMDGTREKFIGDAVFAVFGWPRAHDDDAVRAGLAALAIRAALHDIADGGEPMEVRIGIATGEVVAGAAERGSDGDLRLTGEAITTAARIQSMATPGEILLDDATRRAARDRLATEPRGAVVLRGQSVAVELHGLRGEAGASPWIPYRRASAGPLVGRDAERATIEAQLDRARETGRGAVVLVEGDAGMGKSRLLASLERDARERGFAWTWTENVSYGLVDPYRWARLFAQVVADEYGVDSGTLTRRFVFTDEVTPEARRRLGGAIAAMARDAAFSGWEAEAADMPVDPTELTATLSEVAARYLASLLGTTGPRTIVIDDLHWLDPSSVGLVELIVQRTADQPLVVLAASRPGAAVAWATADRVTRIKLAGLALPDTGRLATLVARAAVDADGARSIHERTAGNPLFIGETVRAMLEDGSLLWRDGRVALVGSAERRLPVTLRAVLGARIDGLPSDAREALGVASVIGITFRPSDVDALLDGSLDAGAIDHLARGALIVPVDDGSWRFAHALIRDAAYAGLLASRRRELHGRLADRLAGSAVVGAPGLVAAHRVAAGDGARAIPLLRDAGEHALALGAPTEAAAFWRQAADLEEADDPIAATADRARAAEALAARSIARVGVSAASTGAHPGTA